MSRTKPYSRTIPHPLFERLIVEDAMNEDKESWKPERPHEYGYFPGCVDFMDVEVKFTHLNKGDADHASIAAASIKLLNYADIDPLVLDMNIFKCSGHDQLWQGQLEVFDALKEEEEDLCGIIKHAMENVVGLEVPLLVEIGKGQTWLDAH